MIVSLFHLSSLLAIGSAGVGGGRGGGGHLGGSIGGPLLLLRYQHLFVPFVVCSQGYEGSLLVVRPIV